MKITSRTKEAREEVTEGGSQVDDARRGGGGGAGDAERGQAPEKIEEDILSITWWDRHLLLLLHAISAAFRPGSIGSSVKRTLPLQVGRGNRRAPRIYHC